MSNMRLATKKGSRKALTRSLAVIAVLAVLCGLMLASPAQAAVSYSSEEIAFVQLINNYRTGLGLQPLLVSDRLSESGDRHDSDMGKYGFFGHYTQGSDWFAVGASPWDRMAASGYAYNTYKGENLAAGYDLASTVFAGWKNSPAHNENMVNPNFKVMGVSFVWVSGSLYRNYWTTDFGGFVDPTAHSVGSSASTTTTAAPTTTTTKPTTSTTLVRTTTTTTTYVPPTTTTTTVYKPPSTTTTTVPDVTFSDVGGGTLYSQQILLLAKRGIVNGYSNGSFGPYDRVTRQQFAKMIILAEGYAVSSVSPCSFKDVTHVPDSSDPLYPAGYIAPCDGGHHRWQDPRHLRSVRQDHPGATHHYGRACRQTWRAAFRVPAPVRGLQRAALSRGPVGRRMPGCLDGLAGMGPDFDFWASATRGEVCLLLADLLGARGC